MKSTIFALATLFSLAAAIPQITTHIPIPVPSSRSCYCEPVFCPLEIIAECKCRNAAAQSCYEAHLASGITCPSPTPRICGTPVRRSDVATPPTKTTLATTTSPVATSVFPRCAGLLGIECPKGLVCVDDPRDGCDPENGGSDCIGICVGPKL
ncbi:hypothetical protein P280DRAFT_482410 [Massarina eburnea CBS 473.64]|uniref:Extracellular membrane protein CFEM domain-containing protein n=1 Tax=Massarina eburnea CBS 473.64 TaxID=1395130 RepID=A0A6A6RUB3_9PLEO|nr:hypothetical protein P280DRAFT_482410 [Massarina eburnea CBS 473.64]